MKVLLTGANGQLGRRLVFRRPSGVELAAYGRADLDVTDAAVVEEAASREKPDWIINAAAYTHVDRAEDETDAAFAANAEGPRLLAAAAVRHGARLLQVSTDFVFSGEKSHPYRTSDAVDPICAYGASKAAGERAVREALPDRHLIIRTAWLYDETGRNFLTTMLRLMGKPGELRVVDDQVGTPTHAGGLADAIWIAIERALEGTLHWTDAGVASWYDFACAIYDAAGRRGLVAPDVRVLPIPGSQYPTRARRPAFSVLDKSETWERLGAIASHWRRMLETAFPGRGA